MTKCSSHSPMTGRSSRRIAAACLLIGLAAAACASSDEEARGYAVDHLRSRAEAATRFSPYIDIADVLPNVRYEVPGEPARRPSVAAVVGRITSVDPGYGFAVPGGDGNGIRIRFDDSKAVWKTVHLSVEIERHIAGTPVADNVKVGLAIGGSVDADEFSDGLRLLGRAVFILNSGSPVFAYDSSLYSIPEDGALLVLVDDEGRLTVPSVDQLREDELLRSTPTLDRLVDKARSGERVVQMRRREGVAVRD